MRFFKSEPCALVIIFKLFTVFLFHSGFSFYFSNAHFENTSLGQLCFPEREQEKISMAASGEKNRDRSALRAASYSESHTGSEHSPRERQNLRDRESALLGGVPFPSQQRNPALGGF